MSSNSDGGYAEAQRRIEENRANRLPVLSLFGLSLASLPPEIVQLEHLVSLKLGFNELTSLPSEIDRLAALTYLNLEGNKLTSLPPEIGRLRGLRFLFLESNCLASLPAEIGGLSALRLLVLRRNELTTLPPEIGQLRSLKWLNLSDNHLATLPHEIKQLTTLKELYLHGNPQLGIPGELLGPPWEYVLQRHGPPKPPNEILAAYFRVAGGQGEALNECKLIVVGRGLAGKTSLIKRLRDLPYDPNEPETHGITIQKLRFHRQDGDITARVWDFGGQIVLHSMHEFFLTARSLYLLVLGERDDFLEKDAAYWLQLIRSYAGDAPVVVALNKSAGRQRPFDRQSLEQAYGPILGFVSTECSDVDLERGGIIELRETLRAALDGPLMDSVRRRFPRKWRSIKDDLEAMPDSYLDYAEYIRRCVKHGETDAREQAALAGDLHDLGVALNYSRDPRLRDTSVLRPDWLANGIYAVLRANDRDQTLPAEFDRELATDGVVDAETLALIHRKAEARGMLTAADYPPEKRKFLLRLMDLFQLSFPLERRGESDPQLAPENLDEGRKRLVPTLLPLTPPAGSEEPQGDGCLRSRYEFQVVPAPLLLWFIARTFSLIPDRLHWRRGAFLAYGDARARVWTTPDERHVFVTVAPSEDGDELLTMIRGTLRDLFAGYRGLQVTEQCWFHNAWVPRSTLEEFGKIEPDPVYDPADQADARIDREEGQS